MHFVDVLYQSVLASLGRSCGGSNPASAGLGTSLIGLVHCAHKTSSIAHFPHISEPRGNESAEISVESQ